MTGKLRAMCFKGLHALSGTNLYISPRGDRMCRACRRAGRTPTVGGRHSNFPKIKYCSKGHAVISPNIKIRRDCVVCRRCHNDFHSKSAASGPISAAVLERITFAIVESGAGLGTLAGRSGKRMIGPRIVRIARFRKWVRENPTQGKPLLKQARANGALLYEAARLRSIITAPSIIRATDDIMDEIEAAVPLYLSKDLRDDAIQNIWLAVIERRLKRDEITSRARKFISAEYRINHDKYKPRSLDMPTNRENPTAAVNFIRSDAPMWERLP